MTRRRDFVTGRQRAAACWRGQVGDFDGSVGGGACPRVRCSRHRAWPLLFVPSLRTEAAAPGGRETTHDRAGLGAQAASGARRRRRPARPVGTGDPGRSDRAPARPGRRPARRRPPGRRRRGSRRAAPAALRGTGEQRATPPSPPVCTQITAFGRSWLLDVSDAAVDRQPAFAVGRDAAHGGLGLHLVARLCGAYGWAVADNRKHLWAGIDHTPPAPGSGPRAQHG